MTMATWGNTRIAFATAIMATMVAGTAAASESHGLSAFGDLKYAPDFKHFSYVNADAPKGGRLATIGTLALVTFDSLNGFILKGDPAQGLEFLFDTLMVRAQDEPDAMYGLVARSAEVGDDGRSVTFRLRPEARFADGSPVTAEDIVFSFAIIKEKGHPSLALPLRDVSKAMAIDDHTVRYMFSGDQTRNLPLLVAGLPVLSKAYYAKHSFEETTLEPPLGSGPYAVADLKQGTFITYRRRDDYWARDLPVNRGRFNFDEPRYEYFRDRVTGFEAFKAGAFDLREEFTSKSWATAYDFAAVRDGRVLLEILPDGRPAGTQGFFINTRRAKFADVRVRAALDLAFDFEWINKNLFHGLYKRTHSYFQNSPMKADGPPATAELALIEPHRGTLPKAVFEAPYLPPVTDGSGRIRRQLRDASRLLTEAGWTIRQGKRQNASGDVMAIEFLIFSPSFERIIAPYIKNLKRLGIDARTRQVDPAQYRNRLKSFDFDITTSRFAMPVTPGPELRQFFSSRSADVAGSFNLAGIKDSVVDELLTRIAEARTRDDLIIAARALDRVLRAGHYWVSHWYKASHTVAYWDKFSRPDTKPAYSRGILDTWWYDANKAARLKQAQ